MANELDTLNVGDEVCIIHRTWDRIRDLRISKVEKVTATQITAFGGKRYAKKTGHEIGSHIGRYSVYSNRLCKLTDEIRAEYETDVAQSLAEAKCRKAAERLTRLTCEDAVRVAALLPDELTDMPQNPANTGASSR